jgi:hypothetical protein
LLHLFKRNNRLTKITYFRSHRSPLMSGYHFVFFLIACILLATCGINHSLAVPLNKSQTPQSKIQSTATQQSGIKGTTVPLTASQPGKTPSPSLPSTAKISPSITAPASPTIPLTPTNTQATATSTPGVFATSDLLFISDDRLMRWDHVTHYSSSLAENVVAFSTNATGSKIVLLRPKGMAANGNELFDLDLLDFSSKQTRHLIEGTPRMLNLALSPDGDWLVYQLSLDDNSAAIKLLSLSSPMTTENLAQCEILPPYSCSPPVWSSGNQSLLWADRRGVWIADIKKGSVAQLHSSTIEVLDPLGKSSQIDAQLSSPEWSPTGRFALVQVIPNHSDASWHVVIDSLTGRLRQVLDSYKLSPTQVSVSWLPDGKLAVARSSDQSQQTPATIQVWEVLATNSDLLVSTGLYKFPSSPLSSETASLAVSNPAINTLRLDWIQQSNPGHLLFGAYQPDIRSQTGLYDLNMQTNSIIQIVQLTSDVEQVLWAPDGSGMLITTSDKQTFFTSADGKETINLELSVGSTPAGFIWLPPSLRK